MKYLGLLSLKVNLNFIARTRSRRSDSTCSCLVSSPFLLVSPLFRKLSLCHCISASVQCITTTVITRSKAASSCLSASVFSCFLQLSPSTNPSRSYSIVSAEQIEVCADLHVNIDDLDLGVDFDIDVIDDITDVDHDVDLDVDINFEVEVAFCTCLVT